MENDRFSDILFSLTSHSRSRTDGVLGLKDKYWAAHETARQHRVDSACAPLPLSPPQSSFYIPGNKRQNAQVWDKARIQAARTAAFSQLGLWVPSPEPFRSGCFGLPQDRQTASNSIAATLQKFPSHTHMCANTHALLSSNNSWVDLQFPKQVAIVSLPNIFSKHCCTVNVYIQHNPAKLS